MKRRGLPSEAAFDGRTQKLEATLYLRGEHLDPAKVTSLLGLAPTKSQRKGEQRSTSTNRQVTAKIGLWALAAETTSDDLSVLVDELASRIGVATTDMRTIPGVEEAFLDVFVVRNTEPDGGGTCEFELSAGALQALARTGAAARFTVVVVKP